MSVFVLACVASAFAAEPWEDPAVNEINRLPARVLTIPCESEELAFDIRKMDRPKDDSRWVMSLAGDWDFKWKSATAVADWEKSCKIRVPGCWQLQGDFDPPLYTNSKYPIARDAPHVTKEPSDKGWTSYRYRNPVGLYTTTFKRPWRWWFRKTIIRFYGVSSAFRLRVNGREVGYAEDSRLPSEFDLTPYLKVFGRNVLEVEVYKHCDGTYLEDQDFWRLSGIFRDVLLISESKRAPFDYVVETRLADDLKSGTFVIRDENGRVLKSRDVPDVRLWSPEVPFVYMTPVENKWGWWLFGGTDYRAVTFGFRKVDITNAVLRLNGKRVLVKGVNRHEMEPATGYTVTEAGMRKDVFRMKEFNVNAVRTCHYPDVPEWYDLCDTAGLMVCCEANVEAHGYDIYRGTDQLSFRKDFERAQVERGTRMVKFFRNHPSIVIWSLGNESGYGPNFKAEYRALRALDATRPIQYENYCKGRIGALDASKNGMTGDEQDYTDLECPMYGHPKDAERYVANRPTKPFVFCEYAHAMGNSTGGMREYWNLAAKYPSFQGGFVWDFSDQALWKTEACRKWLAYGGDFGDQPNDGNFNCNGMFDALRNPHPGAYEIKHAYQNVHCTDFDFARGTVKVRNDYLFKDLKDHICKWRSFSSDGKPVAKGSFALDGVAAGGTAEFALVRFAGDAVTFTVSDEYDDGIAWDGFVKPFVPPTLGKPVPVAPKPGLFRFNLWRAPTDNDRGWKMAEVCKIWKEATDAQKLPAGVAEKFETSRLEDGSLLVDWTLTVPKGLPPIPRVGLTFTVPKVRTVEYFGLGPWENYADRATAATLGSYRASVVHVSGLADPKTGTIAYPDNRLNPDNYIEPGEQGYRTGCRSLKVGGVMVKAVSAPFGFNVWPYPQSMLEGKGHQWELLEADEMTVNIDTVQMGVGGDNSWGARPHDAFMPGAGTYRLSFVVHGL